MKQTKKKSCFFFWSSLTVYIHVENLNMTVCSVLFSLLVCLWIVATHTHTQKKGSVSNHDMKRLW